jgi:defect-in-organelle-trafficking protein DotB
MKNHLTGADTKYLFPNEPSVFLGKDVDKILLHTTPLNTSDVTIQTNAPIIAEIYGRLVPITRHRLNYNEVQDMLAYITKSDGAFSHIMSAKAWDIAHEVKPNRDTRLRFRVNATGIQTEGQVGVQITLRTIPSMPPLLADMQLPEEILLNRAPKQGLVLVTGATGSGKSTLLASIIRDLLEDPNSHRKILTYEQPIEFVYDDVIAAAASIAQTQIPDMLPDFTEALRNALRRKPAVILVGEMRDRETIAEGITASMTGHLVYSTVHTNGVAETARRMINSFSKDEQHSRGIDIVSSLRMVISQMLLPSTDGKRLALREYLIMNDSIAAEMMDNIDNLPAVTRRLLKKHGRTFLQDAQEKFDQKRLDVKQFNYIRALSQGMDRDLM